MSRWYQDILDQLLADPLARAEWQGETYFLVPVTWTDPGWTHGATRGKIIASCPTRRFNQWCAVPEKLDYHYQVPLVEVPPVERNDQPRPCLENWIRAKMQQMRLHHDERSAERKKP